MQDEAELSGLLAEGRAALVAHPLSRVHDTLVVLPRLVTALDRVCKYQTELRDVRAELTLAVRSFREAVWDAQRKDPSITCNAAPVQRELGRVNELLDRLDRLIHTEEP